MAGGYGDKGAAPHGGWRQSRIGAEPPDVLRALRSEVGMAVCAATCVPPSLIADDSDGTAQREAWRRFAHGSVAPLGRIVAAELADKLDVLGFAFDFSSLYASDVVGRASAFRNPRTGEPVEPRAMPLFQPSRHLRGRVDRGHGSSVTREPLEAVGKP